MLRKLMITGAMLGLFLSLALWGISHVHPMIIYKGDYSLAIIYGSIAFMWSDWGIGSEGDLNVLVAREARGLFIEWRPFFISQVRSKMIGFPLWLSSVLSALALFASTKLRRSARALSELGLCIHCGYDLQGSIGQCPECGDDGEFE